MSSYLHHADTRPDFEERIALEALCELDSVQTDTIPIPGIPDFDFECVQNLEFERFWRNNQ